MFSKIANTASLRSMISKNLALSLALFAGRISGFAREIFLASKFGVSTQADIAILILTLPDLLVGILLSGGLSIALIPILQKSSKPLASALFSQVTTGVFFAFGILGLILSLQPTLWLNLLAPGIAPSIIVNHSSVFVLITLAIPLSAISGVTTACHQANNKFFIAGLGTLIFNISVILSLVVSQKIGYPLLTLSIGIVIGCLLRWLSQLLTLPHYLLKPHEKTKLLIDIKFIKVFSSAAIAASLTLIAPIIIRSLASSIGEGQIASFNYALKLIELPVGVLITTISTVLYPIISKLYSEKNQKAFYLESHKAIQQSLLLSIAIALCGTLFIDSVVKLLFFRGELNLNAVQNITALTKVALWSIPFIALSNLASAVLNASEKTKTVLKITLVNLVFLASISTLSLIYNSALLLMLMLVFFYISQSILLSKSANIYCFSGSKCLDKLFLIKISKMIITVLFFYFVSQVPILTNDWIRLLMMITSFLIMYSVSGSTKYSSEVG